MTNASQKREPKPGDEIISVASDAAMEGDYDQAAEVLAEIPQGPKPAPLKSFNFSAMVVGLPGYGKTSVMTSLVRRHIATTPGIVLVHDPMGQFVEHGCMAFESADAWRDFASDCIDKKTPMPRGASLASTDADEVTSLALELGEKLNSAKRVTVPILVAYDEGSLRGASGSTYISPLDNQALALRRHRGIGMIYNLQTPTQLTARFWQMATDAYVFAQTSSKAKQLDELLFLEPGELARAGVTRLPKFEYIHVRQGDGIVEDAL